MNEISAGDSYVHITKNSDSKIIHQSKGLGEVATEKVFLVCMRVNEHAVVKSMLIKIFKSEVINAHPFRHTRATMLIEKRATPRGVQVVLVIPTR